MHLSVPFAAVAALLTSTLIVDISQAAGGKSIVACSRYGHGCYTAPVRKGRWGPEVRLSNGRWLDCAHDCHMALREETVDFWETQRESTR